GEDEPRPARGLDLHHFGHRHVADPPVGHAPGYKGSRRPVERAAGHSAFGLTPALCHISVSHVKRTTIRELKHDTTTVLSWVAGGEPVEVYRRREAVALLSPPKRRAAIRRPDFVARLRSIYGKKVLATTGTDVVSESRGTT